MFSLKCIYANLLEKQKEFMHLSMLRLNKTRTAINTNDISGSGWADPGEFDILMEARLKFPTPRHLLNVNFPPLGT